MTKTEMQREADKYAGVSIVKDRARRYAFSSRIAIDGRQISLGTYNDPKDAAKAYDMAVLKNGLNRKTNFIKKKL